MTTPTTTKRRSGRAAQTAETDKLLAAAKRVIEKRARELVARLPNEPKPNWSSPRPEPNEQRPSATATAPPLAKVLLSQDDLRDLGIRFSRSQLHKLGQLGDFPKPVKLSPFRNAWVADEVYAWIKVRKANRVA